MTSPLHVRLVGAGEPILFLHGLAGSHGYWGRAYDGLGVDHQLIFVDERGFGRSRGVAGPYDFDGHMTKLDELADVVVGQRPRIIVGHSFGAVLALHLAARWPEVTTVIGFGLPAYANEDEARDRMSRRNTLAAWTASGDQVAELTSAVMSTFRPLARLLAPLLAPQLPLDVARAGVEHSWPALKQSFDAVVGARLRDHVRATAARVVLVQGDNDEVCGPARLRQVLAGAGVEVRTLVGDHHLPLRDPAACVDVIRDVLHPCASRQSA